MDRVEIRTLSSCFGCLLALIAAVLTGAVPVSAEKSFARVLAVEGNEVVFEAGLLDGLHLDAEVLLLRTSEPIVHPLSGEVLGRAEEPVGIVRIIRLKDKRAWGKPAKMYADPKIGDMGEYTRAAPPLQPVQAVTPRSVEPVVASAPQKPDRLDGLEQRMKQLEGQFKEWREHSGILGGTALDELGAMQAILTQIDHRLADVESQFSGSKPLEGDEREFVIRYSADTQVQLKVAGKTLSIDVVPDSLAGVPDFAVEPVGRDMASAPTPPTATDPELTKTQDGPSDQLAQEERMQPPAEAGDDDELAWYQRAELGDSSWILAFSILFFGMVAGFVSYAIKRKYENGLDELEDPLFGDYDSDFDEDEDFDDDFLDDDDLDDEDLDGDNDLAKPYK